MTNREILILLDGITIGAGFASAGWLTYLGICDYKNTKEYKFKMAEKYGNKIDRVDKKLKDGKISDDECERLKRKYALKLFKKLHIL